VQFSIRKASSHGVAPTECRNFDTLEEFLEFAGNQTYADGTPCGVVLDKDKEGNWSLTIYDAYME